jgi:hypothetical protein
MVDDEADAADRFDGAEALVNLIELNDRLP